MPGRAPPAWLRRARTTGWLASPSGWSNPGEAVSAFHGPPAVADGKPANPDSLPRLPTTAAQELEMAGRLPPLTADMAPGSRAGAS